MPSGSRLLSSGSSIATSGPGITYPNVAGHPKLADINSMVTGSDADNYSQCGLVILQSPTNIDAATVANYLAKQPLGKLIFYFITQSVALSKYASGTGLYDQMTIYPGHWLLMTRTTLTGAINGTVTSIPVADLSKFTRANLGGAYANAGVPVDLFVWKSGYGTWEHMRMATAPANGSTGAGNLTVTRGYNSTAQTTFTTGDFIAAHLSSFAASWGLNVTSACPLDASGRSWIDVAMERIQWLYYQLGVHGVFLDSSSADISGAYPNADANNDGVADGGNPTTSAWYYGELNFVSQVRARLGPKAIIDTNGGIYIPASNGAELEHSPYYRQGSSLESEERFIDYQNDKVDPDLRFSIENGDVNNDQGTTWDFTPSSVAFSSSGLGTPITTNPLQMMRLAFGMAAFKGIYAASDLGGNGHGNKWYPDEAMKGYGTALAAAMTSGQTFFDAFTPPNGEYIANVSVPRIPHDDVTALPADLMMEQVKITAISIGGGTGGSNRYTVTRGFNGTTARSHRAGQKVFTLADMLAGIGWLGAMSGSPVYIPTTVPVTVINGDFESSTATNVQPTGWATYGLTGLGVAPGTTYGTVGYDTQAFAKVGSGTQSLKMTITTLPPSYFNAGVQQANIIQSAIGDYYVVTFKARATRERQIQVALQQSVGGSAAVTRNLDINQFWPNGYYTVVLGPTTWADAAATSVLKFHIGQQVGDVELDQVSVVKNHNRFAYQDFQYGRVYINMTPTSQSHTPTSGAFRKLLGRQNPTLNDGSLITGALTIPSNDALFVAKV